MAMLCMLPGVGMSQNQRPWQWSHPEPHGNNIADLAHRKGRYVQVAEYGRIYTSTNRVVWVRRESGTSRELRGVAALGDRWVVAGEEGTVLWSDDGERYQAGTLTPATRDWLEGVAASAEAAVAVGDNGSIYRTTDGISWDRVADTGVTEWLSGVTYADGLFVAVGELGLIATSPDGLRWTKRASGTAFDLLRVAAGDGRYVVVGDGGTILVSRDGVRWTEDPIPNVTTRLLTVAAGGQSVLVGGDATLYLKPLNAWQDQTSTNVSVLPAPEWTYGAAVWDGARFLVGGRSGVTLESLTTNLPTALKYTLWFRPDETPRTWLWDMARLGGVYLAVGDRSTVLTSASGLDWALESVPGSVSNVLYGVGGSPSVAIAVGAAGTLLRSTALFRDVISTNQVEVGGRAFELRRTNQVSLLGVIWEAVDHGLTTETLQGVGWNGSTYVVVGGQGVTLRSSDGAAWVAGSIPSTAFFSSVAASPSTWVATGTEGALFTSPDAESWVPRPLGLTNWIYRARWLEDRWVAVGQKGLLLESADAVGWTRRETGTEAWLTDAERVGSWIYVSGTQGVVMRSRDLLTWETVAVPTGKPLYALAAQGHQLLAAGAEGAVLRVLGDEPSTPVALEQFQRVQDPAGAVDLFLFQGLPEQPFRLESSEALPQWITGDEMRLDAGGYSVLGRPSGDTTRFHRTVSPP